ncbi:MAG: hypothetical protein HY694_18630 [Deltaproteobacteria bacterium]|nr:hypothetical protein [Deltaproteobacteria bacterium]
MAVVQGIREKVHLPIYDSLTVEPGKQLRDAESSSTLKFFVNVQGKTKLETNLQSAALLPHYNTFEARAMRVVISDLPPEFSEEVEVEVEGVETATPTTSKTLNTDLRRAMELLEEARADQNGETEVSIDTDGVEVDTGGTAVTLTVGDLEAAVGELDRGKSPPKEQIRPNNGAGTLIGRFIYNTVTTFYVGEKIMIQMPTWFFPAGAGPYSEAAKITTHGEPSPTATFRFAEPIFVDKQQNFRVEIEIPDAEMLKELHKIYGPFFIWVVLDGYMTRDVQ